MKKRIGLIAIMGFVIALTSCKHSNDITEQTPVNKDTACDPNVVYFVNDIQPILNSNCAYSGCHDVVTHADGVDLSSYDKVISTGEVKAGNPKGSELYKKILEGEMPPSGSMSSSQKQKIYDWIMQGAKNNQCTQGCDTMNVTFNAVIKPIMDDNCMGCHSAGSPSGGIAITNYAQVKTIASDGSLMGTIEHKPGYSSMPKNMAKLSDCNIAQLRVWIREGMKNN